MGIADCIRIMLRLFYATAVGFLTMNLGVIAHASDFPDYCGTSGLSDEQLVKCENAAENAGVERVGDIELIKTRFPFRIELLNLKTEYNIEKPIEVNISSEDGTYLRIQYRNSDPFILIPRERIVRWSIGSKNSVDASGAIGATLGAVFFPPMLLAAPFGIGNVKTHQYIIQYINEQAEPRTLVLAATHWHRETLSALRAISRLSPNESRSDEQIESVQRDILDKLVAKREKLSSSMISRSNRKPWCEYIDFSANPEKASTHNRLTKQITAIVERLKITEPVDNMQSSSDDKWQEHLDENPSLKLWAEANRSAADNLKECPPQ